MQEDSLKDKQSELLKVLEALNGLEKNKDWQTLKELVYQKSLESVEAQMKSECLSTELNLPKLYRLQGEWSWAKQFTDIPAFAENVKKQLATIKQMLK